ncbi:MAG TPA: hypothetical protein ENH85_15170 [Candidatus Scalindua sp.]|nr:hypothetical protein [Candidatus Scalindua sp.]
MKQLSKKEGRLLKKQGKQEEQKRKRRKQKIKKRLYTGLLVLIIGGGIFALGWFLLTRPSTPESKIISKQGIHWHADLSIKILGRYQGIPGNIGIGITELPVHTHEADSVIHMEFSGLVREDDTRLGRFFEIWGKKFNRDCIFDKCNGPEGRLKMFVNQQPNYQFENHIMRDRDKIEIIFEQQ